MPNVLVNDDSLKAIGNAIREKNGETTKYKPAEMAAAITAISGGGEATIEALSITSNGTYNAPDGVDGYNPITVNVPQDGVPTDDELKIKGLCTYRFANDGWSWFIKKYGNRITTQDISDMSNMFWESPGIETIPFQLNSTVNYSSSMNNLFSGCQNLRTLPENFFNITLSTRMNDLKYTNTSNMFSACYSLRNIPDLSFLGEFKNLLLAGYYYNFYYSTFTRCYALDEIVNLPVIYSPGTNQNYFYQTFSGCGRLKRLTFGTVYNQGRWSGQVIDLSDQVGYTLDYRNVCNYNSGIDNSKQAQSDSQYQALKNDPDWFSTSFTYSRYNHDSAVETINSLPDCSEYAAAQGINTIKFKSLSGSKTDGGAINTLTEEEIAVAAAKGWTVTFS